MSRLRACAGRATRSSWLPWTAVTATLLVVMLATAAGARPRAHSTTGARHPQIALDWEISRAWPGAQVARDAYPPFFAIFASAWEPIAEQPPGRIDIASSRAWGPNANLVFARTIVRADRRHDVELSVSARDGVDLFLNGKTVVPAGAGRGVREPFAGGEEGTIGRATLTLEKGLNEILLMVEGSADAWSFTASVDRELERPIKDHARLTKRWETPAAFLTPESVQYDAQRNVLYVSSFDVSYAATPEATGFISRLSLDGAIEELHWITGLNAPTGMGIAGDRLYVLERGHLTEIDIAEGAVTARHPVPGSDFLNDLTVAADGVVYMTDTRPSSHADSRIYRFKDGEVDVWLDGDEIERANGLFHHAGRLLVGNTGDGSLKAVDLSTRAVDKIVTLGAGVVDGIRVTNDGYYLVSHWEGQVYLVSPTGVVVEILDTLPEAVNNTADFEFVAEQDLLVIPTFLGNRVIAYQLGGR